MLWLNEFKRQLDLTEHAELITSDLTVQTVPINAEKAGIKTRRDPYSTVQILQSADSAHKCRNL